MAAQSRARAALPPDDGTDRAEAERGLVAREESLRVLTQGGDVAFEQDGFAFVKGDAPPSVHPSLWRQAALNDLHGVYKVVDGVHQVRGYDLANLTLIEGKTGWIVVDPLTTRETAERALAFARKTLGDRRVAAVLFTHSHVDHFGGALAVTTPEDVASGKVQVIAPEGFLEEATSENVMAGPAMGRRATYMYGRDLPRSERARVDNGLGKEPAAGAVAILPPTHLVGFATRSLVIDGVPFEFQYTPGSEAPAELTFYLPEQKAFCGAEVLSRTLHNLYTLRGAKVRDARKWAGYIDEALDRFADAEVLFMSHHWPVFGKERLRLLMVEQRDTYRYIHDQTLRLANQGYGPREISEKLTLPAALRKHYWNRDYYGTVKHNVKAVYQAYFGWYDGNPATLDPLPRVEAAERYVEAMGGPAAVLGRARASYEKGEYRWVAEVLSHLVAAEPGNTEAKGLLAEAFDQLGYVAESSAWRNVYLTGASELRRGAPEKGVDAATVAGLLEQTSPDELLKSLQVALNGENAEGVSLTINLTFKDLGETHVLHVENSVLHVKKGPPAEGANAGLTVTRPFLVKVFTRQVEPKAFLSSPDLEVTGSTLDLLRFFSLLDRPDLAFPIVTPKR
ncbi:MAG: MBL fold metallo-hydrolase [Deltaproteobacteria bacterium]|nr:MBL fold metallo-hydrolase [Deltaproteobacteria bacterium]